MTDINKFNTLETLYYKNFKENPVFENIENLFFFEPSSELRKFMLLNEIYKTNKISQKQLSNKIKVVPAMINKYISEFKIKKIINVEGENHRKTRYYLSEKGKKQREKYLFEFMREILLFYKDIKKEIKFKLKKLKLKNNLKIILYGANEFSELIIQLSEEFNFKILNIVDSSEEKQGTYLNSVKILSPLNLLKFDFDMLIITSISNKDEIYKSVEYLIQQQKQIIKFAEI